MSGVLQGSWGLGFLLSSVVYSLFYDYIGWRGMLWIGILPALSVVWVRKFVKEPPVWLENRRKQRESGREGRAPLVVIFNRQFIGNTLTPLLVDGELHDHLLFDLGVVRDTSAGLGPVMVGAPLAIANLVGFLAMGFWGWIGDVLGRRWSMIIPAAIGIFITRSISMTVR
jgi:MFS transporter, SHS family, lactate transporter